MKKNNIINSPRLKEIKKKKRKIVHKKIIIGLVIFILLITGLAFFSNWKEVEIQEITVEGNKIIEKEDIKLIINEELKGKYLFLFSKKNFIIYPKNKIEKKLKNNFKRIKEIQINDKDIKNLIISINEYEGAYIWCGEKILENFINQECYFLDKFGYIFDEAPYFSGEVYFKFYGNISSEEIIGSYFLPEYFSKIIFLKDSINKINLKTSSFYLEDQEEGIIYLSSQKQPPFSPKILFKINSDYYKLIDNLHSIITTEPLESNLKNKFNDLEYLDLRFGNKVFYKFK